MSNIVRQIKKEVNTSFRVLRIVEVEASLSFDPNQAAAWLGHFWKADAGHFAQALEVPAVIAKWEPLMGVKVERFFVQRMKTKWGGCSPW